MHSDLRDRLGEDRVARGLAGSRILGAISGALWIAAFLLFEFVYGRMLLTPRPGPQ